MTVSPSAVFAARVMLAALALALLWRVIQVNVVLYEDTGRPRLEFPGSAPANHRASDHSALRHRSATTPRRSQRR